MVFNREKGKLMSWMREGIECERLIDYVERRVRRGVNRV